MNIDTITTQGVSTMKNNLPPFIEIYRALIATPSISATEEALDQSNESLINLLAGWFRDLGFNVEIQPVPDTRHKFNLLASTGHGAGGLLLAGHTDTVPFDDGRWTRDPFTLTEHDNKLYGLGTADMKGFFAFILDALRDVDVTTLKKPLYILATADEETSMAGARYFAETTRLRPDCAIIGEPTSLQPIRAHKGHMSNAIRIQGQSGHSSDPARGVNAIELMPYSSYSRCLSLSLYIFLRYCVHRILSLKKSFERRILAVIFNGEDLCQIKAQYSEKRLRINDHTVIKYIHIKITAAGNAHKLLCLFCRRKFYFFLFHHSSQTPFC